MVSSSSSSSLDTPLTKRNSLKKLGLSKGFAFKSSRVIWSFTAWMVFEAEKWFGGVVTKRGISFQQRRETCKQRLLCGRWGAATPKLEKPKVGRVKQGPSVHHRSHRCVAVHGLASRLSLPNLLIWPARSKGRQWRKSFLAIKKICCYAL